MKKTAIVFGLLLSGSISPVLAETDDADFQRLHDQFQLMTQRLDKLEQSNADLRRINAQLQDPNRQTVAAVEQVGEKTEAIEEQVKTSSSVSSWTDRIRIKGDFRFRQEYIDDEGKRARYRERIRARALIAADVSENASVGLGFASGGDDPVSTNQTLGGGGSTKAMNLDLAYFDYTGFDSTKIVGGKFKNVLYRPAKHGLLWDGDWNPEGLGLAWKHGQWFANALGSWLESDTKKATELSYALQAGIKTSIGEHAKLTAGLGYSSIGTAGNRPFFGDGEFFGNSFDPVSNTYIYDYQDIEIFAELGFNLGNRPATVFADFVQNQDADQFDTGYAVGMKYGSAKSKGTWQLGYVFQNLEADAVYGQLTDSDFGGGGTDAKGHILKGNFAVSKNLNAKFTYFINQKDANAGDKHDFDRMQLDLSFKY